MFMRGRRQKCGADRAGIARGGAPVAGGRPRGLELGGPRLRSPTRANWPSGPHTKMGNCSNIHQYVFTPPFVFPRRRSNGKITFWESEPAVAKRTANWIGRELSRVHSGMEWKWSAAVSRPARR